MEHLKQASLEVRQWAVHRLAKALFDDGMGDQEWPTKWEITRCVLFGERQIWKNAILCMVKEQLGLGPKYYQIITAMDIFAMSRIQYLIRMLSHEKFVPKLDILRSPLRRQLAFPSQAKKIQAISNREIPLEELPNYCSIYKTNLGHPSAWAWL